MAGSMSLLLLVILLTGPAVHAAESSHRHESGAACGAAQPDVMKAPRFEGVQIETADIAQHEWLFEAVLMAQTVFKVDHPQVDHLRGYCYRDVLLVIRQDLKTPRPTGWVQVNFAVPNAEAIRTELEGALLAARDKNPPSAARLQLKPDVPRSNCRVIRLELTGPEGLMIGFDQVKPETCHPSSFTGTGSSSSGVR